MTLPPRRRSRHGYWLYPVLWRGRITWVSVPGDEP